jgi:xanthine dehydrogenase accessory factor
VAAGERCALATLVNGRFSGGGPGSKLAVRSDGEVAGAFPGAVLGDVVEAAGLVLEGAPARLVDLGGGFETWVELYVPGRAAQVVASEGRAVLVTLLAGAAPGAKLVVEAGGRRSGSLGSPELDDEAARLAAEMLWQEMSERRGTMFLDVLVPPPQLWVFGAGRIAGCLRQIGHAIGWRVSVIDPVAAPGDDGVITAGLDDAVARLGGVDPATSIVVVSHDRAVDVPALALALRSPARFVGAMGSRRTQAARRDGLLDVGFVAADLDRISAPVGLDLGAVEYEETALSIMAEVVAARHGRSGGRVAATREAATREAATA